MSWIEKIQSKLIIRTGDSKEYRPNWLNAVKGIEYNVAEFDFPNLSGTLVSRGTPRGTKYSIEIYFQGDDHLDIAKNFEVSANDSRAWTIIHPYYGEITVQPTSLNFDNTVHNVSKITGTVIETITEDAPKITVVPQDKIAEDKELSDNISAATFEADVLPDTSDINTMVENNDTFYNNVSPQIKSTLDSEDYFNKFNSANAKILNATQKPLEAMMEIQAMINAPALFADSVKNRVNMYIRQFNSLRATVESIIDRSKKIIFEKTGSTIISGMALASSVTDENDYVSANEVLDITELLIESYDNFLTDLDTLQSDNGGDEESYIPDADSIIALNNLVNFTISNLMEIALNSKQERSVILEDDSNWILLAHRFYGLNADDTTIETLMNQNNAGLNEILEVKKNRKVLYYV